MIAEAGWAGISAHFIIIELYGSDGISFFHSVLQIVVFCADHHYA